MPLQNFARLSFCTMPLYLVLPSLHPSVRLSVRPSVSMNSTKKTLRVMINPHPHMRGSCGPRTTLSGAGFDSDMSMKYHFSPRHTHVSEPVELGFSSTGVRTDPAVHYRC